MIEVLKEFMNSWLVIGLALIIGIYTLRLCIEGPRYRKRNRIDEKVVIITGCNTGIGKEVALELAQRGAKIYMACRDAARCETARLDIIKRTQNEQIYNCQLDLASLSSVRQFVKKFLKQEQHLDILVNNAGIMASPHKTTVDGFEEQIGVNHLGHFLLTNLLLDALKKSKQGRIVVMTSVAYLFGSIKTADLNSELNYSETAAYCQSKLANLYFTRKLAALLGDTNVTVNCCHPGIVSTELDRHIKWPCWRFFHFMGLYFLKSPRAGAQTPLRLALDPELSNTTGSFFAETICLPVVPWARNQKVSDWLWQESEKLVGMQLNKS